MHSKIQIPLQVIELLYSYDDATFSLDIYTCIKTPKVLCIFTRQLLSGASTETDADITDEG